MGHFGNSERMKSLSDIAGEQQQIREEAQKEFLSLLVEGAKYYRESKRQMKLCTEITTKALLYAIRNNLLEEFGEMKPEVFNALLMAEVKKYDR